MTDGGCVVIPAEYRKALGLEPGDELIVALEDGELRLFTLQQAVRRAQAIVRKYIPEGRSLSDELIAERRAESANE
jgi:AbrB family looped-hinge helix DNA binding protein